MEDFVVNHFIGDSSRGFSSILESEDPLSQLPEEPSGWITQMNAEEEKGYDFPFREETVSSEGNCEKEIKDQEAVDLFLPLDQEVLELDSAPAETFRRCLHLCSPSFYYRIAI
jgi:hypothetical protein